MQHNKAHQSAPFIEALEEKMGGFDRLAYLSADGGYIACHYHCRQR